MMYSFIPHAHDQGDGDRATVAHQDFSGVGVARARERGERAGRQLRAELRVGVARA